MDQKTNAVSLQRLRVQITFEKTKFRLITQRRADTRVGEMGCSYYSEVQRGFELGAERDVKLYALGTTVL